MFIAGKMLKTDEKVITGGDQYFDYLDADDYKPGVLFWKLILAPLLLDVFLDVPAWLRTISSISTVFAVLFFNDCDI